MSAERPKCVNCGKPLSKHIRSISVPFDRTDVLGYVCSLHPDKTTLILMDKIPRLHEQQIERCQEYERQTQRYERQQAEIRASHNEPRQMANRFKYQSPMSQPLPSQYGIWARVWFGRWGYDGQGVFHSGECAKRWGTAVAVSLREKGKV